MPFNKNGEPGAFKLPLAYGYYNYYSFPGLLCLMPS